MHEFIFATPFLGKLQPILQEKQKTNQSKIGKLKIDNESSKTPNPVILKNQTNNTSLALSP